MHEMLTAFEGMIGRLSAGDGIFTTMLLIGTVVSVIKKAMSLSLLFGIVFVIYLYKSGMLHESITFFNGFFDGANTVLPAATSSAAIMQ